MILDTVNKKIQVVLAAVSPSFHLPIVANWVDVTPTTTTPGSTNIATTNTTPVDAVPAPAASVQRVVQSLSVYNKDTIVSTVTVLLDSSGTDYEIVKAVLQPGQSLVYAPGTGWQVTRGGSVASFHAHKNAVDQAAATGTKVTFTTESFDNGGYYDTSLSRWTPPAGVVEVRASINFSAGVGVGEVLILQIHKNGSVFHSSVAYAQIASSLQNMFVQFIDNASGADYYEVIVSYAGAAKTVGGSTIYSWFSGNMT